MSTHYSGTPGEVRALDTYIKLIRGTQTFGKRLREYVEQRNDDEDGKECDRDADDGPSHGH